MFKNIYRFLALVEIEFLEEPRSNTITDHRHECCVPQKHSFLFSKLLQFFRPKTHRYHSTMAFVASWNNYFKGKKITVMGLGLLGGVGDIRFLAEAGADLIVTDLKGEDDAKSSLDALRKFGNIRYTLGRHEVADFIGRDLIIKAPTTPLDSPYIAEAKKSGTPITMWAAFFSRLARSAGATIVGVTGTRGKTTATLMIADIVNAAGKHVISGGNVRGTALLPHLPAVTQESIAVLELDSWKLQGFREEGISPDVAVFTTFFQDHLNYYGGDMNLYLADKAQIFLHQEPGDSFVLGAQAKDAVLGSYSPPVAPIIADASLIEGWEFGIPGEHNRYNAACAALAARALGIEEEACRRALADFKGVPGRLEFLREVRGVKIYNDTAATTPEATLAALDALDPKGKRNIILIMGGADKGLTMAALIDILPRRVKRVVFLEGTGTERIKEHVPDGMVYHTTLASAFTEAVEQAKSGDTILFSPAFASFGMFKNEYDRGEQFNELVKNL